MKDKKQHWIDFYNELTSLYDSLLNPEYSGASVLYQSSTAGFIPNTVNKHYRAVLNVGKETALIKDHIERAKALFYKAVAIDNKEHGTNRKPKLPVYMPYFLDNEDDIFKIQNEYKDYSFVTTGKDFVKLKEFNITNLYLMDLDIKINEKVDFFLMNEYINSFKEV